MEHVNTVAVALYSALSFITVFGYKLPLVFIKGTVVGCREQVARLDVHIPRRWIDKADGYLTLVRVV